VTESYLRVAPTAGYASTKSTGLGFAYAIEELSDARGVGGDGWGYALRDLAWGEA
jgi:hypothetical protein